MSSKINQIREVSEQFMPGKWIEIQLAITAILARGHILIEDVPGMGKTTLVRFIAKVFGLDLKRVQFTNDLLPADILGVSIFRPETREFQFRPGPVFAELVLADELNRAPPKTQSALLQAMEERMVSIEGGDHPLPPLFTVMATQNPRGMLGTFPLPESQLDRFMMKFSMGMLAREAELSLLSGPSRRVMVDEMQPLFSTSSLVEWQNESQLVTASTAILDYILRLLEESRRRPEGRGLSPRAGIDLVRASKAWAWLSGRSHVMPEDVQKVFPFVAGHRLAHHETGSAQERILAQAILESVTVA